MFFRLISMCSICILFFFQLKAQKINVEIEKILEDILASQNEDLGVENLYESLLLYYNTKINLNHTTPEQLSSLYILTPIQINTFFAYLQRNQKLLSINELQVIPHFDLETVRKLKPFVTVDIDQMNNKFFIKRLLSEENNYLLLRYERRLEEQMGYTEAPVNVKYTRDINGNIVDSIKEKGKRYLGDQNKLYGRFRVNRTSDFSLGVTFEKDPGEIFSFDDGKRGFDFYSYHLMLEKKWGFEKIVLGDYLLQVGQGLIFGSNFRINKNAESIKTVKRNNLGILPYTSVIETGFFRGGAFSKRIKKIGVTLMYSNLNQDGNISINEALLQNSLLVREVFVNSILSSGLHRTENELQKKDQINEQAWGGILEYVPNRHLLIGVSGLYNKFDRKLLKKPNNYNQFEFNGDENHLISAYFNYLWQNINFFGEVARSRSAGIGSIFGMIASLSPYIDFAFLHRNYSKEFHSFYGNSFAESARNINEKGSYWGLEIKPNKKHKTRCAFRLS